MPKWKLVTEFTFDSAHYIKDYEGPCGRMHGHSYKVRVEATSSKLHASEYCPHPVMVADFRSLRWAKQDMTKGGLDHSVLTGLKRKSTSNKGIIQAGQIFYVKV